MFEGLRVKEGFPLWRSWRLNRHMQKDVEHIFEGIAENRKDLLMSWTTEYWGHLERLQHVMQESFTASDATANARSGHSKPEHWSSLLGQVYTRAADFTELFILDPQGQVQYSTHGDHIGTCYAAGSSIGDAVQYAQNTAEGRMLLGPYADSRTQELGARSSSFHDAMTLLFIQVMLHEGTCTGMICGRVPNDVIGDLIQRESGHVYPDSGDNYIFMAKPSYHKQILPGTALSRSRFEDRTFTHGENLKDGVHTEYGTVTVKHHTELELIFSDPATGSLHPGVAGTIQNGSNLFVAYPGYPDYRHIPVIGKGVTFQLPHCPDVWGMMCEGDFEEVYRIRSLGFRMFKSQLMSSLVLATLIFGILFAAASFTSPLITAFSGGALCLIFGLVSFLWLRSREISRVSDQMSDLTRFIRMNAEGRGDLTQRLDPGHFQDETRELAKWINNMIDSLEGIMMQVKWTASDVSASQQTMQDTTSLTVTSAERVSGNVHEMIRSMRMQLQDIDIARESTENMKEVLLELERQAHEQIEVARSEVRGIGDKMSHISTRVEESNQSIRAFVETVQEIRNVLHAIEQISSQTQLLALNASIEAARVGEHGQGFAVVASEIRKLAELTSKSTDEVNEIIRHIYQDTEKAFRSMEDGSRVIREGTRLVAAASELLSSAAAEDQRKHQAVDEVVSLMEKIALVSKENRKISKDVEHKMQALTSDIQSVRHTSGSVEAIAHSMQQLVSQFKLTESRIR
ncbi:methyl-accepting chemotaxis sensory transducer [Paenibacillus algicola]|uniref:Methyl-accepting chemotaxis sensory transducer n=1 Tax=Paenibacillus algicola TaxID=2565926 RepID=A0A4P8XS70_9BACL|nr:methyl-accepting chemotaxis protein [Paenibacillus algicola]QCT03439.1 methyl-accepting chemotaxis sensory transducer [Paenibacillus algicola]